MIDLATLTAAEAGALVAAGEVSCTELAQAALDRIHATEPALRAYSHVDVDGALAEAARLDAERVRGLLRGPLHGVPFAVKDVLDAAGLPAESGSRALAGRVPGEDAGSVRRLREAGCVLLGKLVTTELAMRHTEPATRNPWRPELYPGGSSAGAGAAVAVGSALLALGTDAGGSVRVPAALCGVVGLYPTPGTVPLDGYLACSPWVDGIGPLGRTALDCALALEALIGGSARPAALGALAADLAGPVAGLRIGVDHALLDAAPLDPGIRARFAAALDAFATAGCTVVHDLALPELDRAEEVLGVLRGAGASAALAGLLRDAGHLLDEGTRGALEAGARITPAEVTAALALRDRLATGAAAAFAASGVAALALPTVPRAAWTPAEIVSSPRLEIGRFTLLANALGWPAVSIPCGLTPEGLPAALQLLGPPGSDLLLLRLAAAHERVAGQSAHPPLHPG